MLLWDLWQLRDLAPRTALPGRAHRDDDGRRRQVGQVGQSGREAAGDVDSGGRGGGGGDGGGAAEGGHVQRGQVVGALVPPGSEKNIDMAHNGKLLYTAA